MISNYVRRDMHLIICIDETEIKCNFLNWKKDIRRKSAIRIKYDEIVG